MNNEFGADGKKTGGRRFRIVFNSPVVVTFAFICVCVLFLDTLTGSATTRLLFATYDSSLLDPFTYVRLVGHVFGHASWEHLVSNMTIILLIGPMLEEKYGSKFMVKFIFGVAVITGIVANLLYSGIALMGASGVVFAFIMLCSFTSVKEQGIPITFILVAFLYMGEQIVGGVMLDDDVSYLSHIVGGMAGSYVGYKKNKILKM